MAKIIDFYTGKIIAETQPDSSIPNMALAYIAGYYYKHLSKCNCGMIIVDTYGEHWFSKSFDVNLSAVQNESDAVNEGIIRARQHCFDHKIRDLVVYYCGCKNIDDVWENKNNIVHTTLKHRTEQDKTIHTTRLKQACQLAVNAHTPAANRCIEKW